MSNKDKIRKYISEKNIDGMLITSYENRRYVTDFTGSNGYVIITQQKAIIITDSRYTEQAQKEAKGFEIVTYNLDVLSTLKSVLMELNIKNIGYETKKLSDYDITRLRANIDTISWIPLDNFILGYRSIKNEMEIEKIRRAVDIADSTINELCKFIKPGMTEKEVAVELEYLMAKKGSEVSAFGTIVASGKRSSLPHGSPTNKKIEKGDMVVIDFGACYEGYMSDITRTIWVGEPDPKMFVIFNIVLESQEAAINCIRPGIKTGDIDKVHREIFIKHGLEQYSLRGLGHGVGLEIHELPRIIMGGEEEIREGMVFTIEPGLYIPDLGGVRIEDIVYVKQDGCEVLTKSPKVLQVM